MSSRKLADSGASKLSRSRQTSGDVSDLTETVTVARNKTFRLFPRDLVRLRDLTEKLGAGTGRRVSEADVVRAGLVLAEKAPAKELLSALKDSLWE